MWQTDDAIHAASWHKGHSQPSVKKGPGAVCMGARGDGITVCICLSPWTVTESMSQTQRGRGGRADMEQWREDGSRGLIGVVSQPCVI